MRKLVSRSFARLRREKGLTQEDVEVRSGFSQQYLSGLERGKRNPSIVTLYEIAQALGVSHVELEIKLSLREAENAIEHVVGVCGGEPVFRGTRVPARMVAAMKSQGATAEEIVAGFPSVTVRMVELAEIWTMAHPVSGCPFRLSDLGATVNHTKRFSLPLPPGKISQA